MSRAVRKISKYVIAPFNLFIYLSGELSMRAAAKLKLKKEVEELNPDNIIVSQGNEQFTGLRYVTT